LNDFSACNKAILAEHSQVQIREPPGNKASAKCTSYFYFMSAHILPLVDPNGVGYL
jgi:hypothetical protein